LGASIVFDRAAEYYDDTRSLQPETQAAVIAQLADELRDRGRCLEIGVGTGRIALDLHRTGVEMAGVDLSGPMLRKLVEKAGGRPPFPLARADATELPVADRRLGGVVICHVLHLIESWRRAVEELVRVLRPGGVILVETATRPDSAASQVIRHFWSVASPGVRPRRPGLTDMRSLDEVLGGLGFRTRLLAPVSERTQRSLGQVIAALEHGTQSACWGLSEDVRRTAAQDTRGWARGRHGSLDAPHPVGQTITWRAYDAPRVTP
jgi:ubiquinone/menaquinone biosynthesis C-methylase UbiE